MSFFLDNVTNKKSKAFNKKKKRCLNHLKDTLSKWKMSRKKKG